MSKKEYVKEKSIKLKGKDYLQVAHRIIMFRKDHPKGTIATELLRTEGKVTEVLAVIANCDGHMLARAHKEVRKGGNGPAAQFPISMSETGAIGRALGLAGYGTLAGDLDEGQNISDAPIDLGKVGI